LQLKTAPTSMRLLYIWEEEEEEERKRYVFIQIGGPTYNRDCDPSAADPIQREGPDERGALPRRQCSVELGATYSQPRPLLCADGIWMQREPRHDRPLLLLRRLLPVEDGLRHRPPLAGGRPRSEGRTAREPAGRCVDRRPSQAELSARRRPLPAFFQRLEASLSRDLGGEGGDDDRQAGKGLKEGKEGHVGYIYGEIQGM
jgi:hypothetical protein